MTVIPVFHLLLFEKFSYNVVLLNIFAGVKHNVLSGFKHEHKNGSTEQRVAAALAFALLHTLATLNEIVVSHVFRVSHIEVFFL